MFSNLYVEGIYRTIPDTLLSFRTLYVSWAYEELPGINILITHISYPLVKKETEREPWNWNMTFRLPLWSTDVLMASPVHVSASLGWKHYLMTPADPRNRYNMIAKISNMGNGVSPDIVFGAGISSRDLSDISYPAS